MPTVTLPLGDPFVNVGGVVGEDIVLTIGGDNSAQVYLPVLVVPEELIPEGAIITDARFVATVDAPAGVWMIQASLRQTSGSSAHISVSHSLGEGPWVDAALPFSYTTGWLPALAHLRNSEDIRRFGWRRVFVGLATDGEVGTVVTVSGLTLEVDYQLGEVDVPAKFGAGETDDGSYQATSVSGTSETEALEGTGSAPTYSSIYSVTVGEFGEPGYFNTQVGIARFDPIQDHVPAGAVIDGVTLRVLENSVQGTPEQVRARLLPGTGYPGTWLRPDTEIALLDLLATLDAAAPTYAPVAFTSVGLYEALDHEGETRLIFTVAPQEDDASVAFEPWPGFTWTDTPRIRVAYHFPDGGSSGSGEEPEPAPPNPFVNGVLLAGTTAEEAVAWVTYTGSEWEFSSNPISAVSWASGRAADAKIRGDLASARLHTEIGLRLVAAASSPHVRVGASLGELADVLSVSI